MSIYFPFALPLPVALRVGTYTKHKEEREESMKMCQTWLSYPKKICVLIGCHLTFSVRLCKNRGGTL